MNAEHIKQALLLRSGYTTGACAAAAAKAAALTLLGNPAVLSVDIPFPDGTRATFPIEYARLNPDGAEAAVKKDAGDDPDITDGMLVVSTVTRQESPEIRFAAGEGVGMVTKPGLQIPPGQPAINPGPRRMIREALLEVTPAGFTVTVSIPGGRERAAKTFNPRLGIVDGLSVLGTSGQVRPFSVPALRDALACSLEVAQASGVTAPVLVPGHIGRRAALAHFTLTAEQVIEVSNEWGFMLGQAARQSWNHLLLVGHPGKLAKLAEGHWETHSSDSPSVVPFLQQLASSLGIATTTDTATAEGLFLALPEDHRTRLANRLAQDIKQAAETLTRKNIAVMLVAMDGTVLGTGGDLSPWH